jgi:ABC-type glutathione transport system ATPase component
VLPVHHSKEAVRKVLSWLRSKPSAADAPALKDAWRLDKAGAPHALERQPVAERRVSAETRAPSEARPVHDARPPREARVVRELRPQPRPAREASAAAEARPKPAPDARLLKEIEELRTAPPPPRTARPQPAREARAASLAGTLAAFGLFKSFAGRRVVNDVTIGLRRGEAVGLLGPNGAGKTPFST